MALLGIHAEFHLKDRTMLAQHLETFVFQELKRQVSWRNPPVQFHHFRNKDGVEVDIVMEKDGKVAGIEIKPL